MNSFTHYRDDDWIISNSKDLYEGQLISEILEKIKLQFSVENIINLSSVQKSSVAYHLSDVMKSKTADEIIISQEELVYEIEELKKIELCLS